jgi:transcriptional/translational regulatory protein YebC/TACO1
LAAGARLPRRLKRQRGFSGAFRQQVGEEVESKEGTITVFAPHVEFYNAKTALLGAFPKVELDVQEITFLPKESIKLSGDDLALFEKFLGMLNDCDDVQEIYHGVSLS